jgi:hypothetical protein
MRKNTKKGRERATLRSSIQTCQAQNQVMRVLTLASSEGMFQDSLPVAHGPLRGPRRMKMGSRWRSVSAAALATEAVLLWRSQSPLTSSPVAHVPFFPGIFLTPHSYSRETQNTRFWTNSANRKLCGGPSRFAGEESSACRRKVVAQAVVWLPGSSMIERSVFNGRLESVRISAMRFLVLGHEV